MPSSDYFEGALAPQRIGNCPPRARFQTDAEERCLNGDWRFSYHPHAQTGVELSDAGTDWDLLAVPAHWQLGGYGAPIYTNIRYPFPVDPPRVPHDNPTGEYRVDLSISQADLDRDGRWILRFEGIDSGAIVGLNGAEIGQSTGSRLPVEFDVTERLVAGNNLLALRIFQWSAGSYVEDQDQWWLSGIFRDVSLVFQPTLGLWDVTVQADYDHQEGTGTLRVDAVTTASDARVRIAELGIDIPLGQAITVPVDPWSAESPRLYDLEVVGAGHVARLSVGFRRIVVEDGLMKINGRRIVLRGVNRHEFQTDRGRAVTLADMENDVLLMKRHNLNAVRTSHYPPHPAFFDLCDRYGLYVVDECDLETHGFETDGWANNPSATPQWREPLVDRVLTMVERDKNHPSIVMWSLGNEAGMGQNILAMAEALRGLDSSRLVHFEPDQSVVVADVYSRMYAPVDEVQAIGQGAEPPLLNLMDDARRRAMPFVLCEYAHAMGNGPGGLAEYEALFNQYPRCQGGFVWEWTDHGLRTQDANGREFFGYGGDFGEVIHDGSFIVDGLLLPEGTPSPGLTELAAVNAPIRIEGPTPGFLTVTNRYDFASTDGVTFRWRVELDGIEQDGGDLAVPVTPAGQEVRVPLPSFAPVEEGSGELWLCVEAVAAECPAWAEAPPVLGCGQIQVGSLPAKTVGAAVAAEATANGFAIGGARFDTRGTLLRLGSVEVDSARFDCWRAPTENDNAIHGGAPWSVAQSWRNQGLDRLEFRTDKVAIQGDVLVVEQRVAGAGTQEGFRVTHRWSGTVSSDEGAALRLDLDIEPLGNWDVALPRLGYNLVVLAAQPLGCAIEWFGTGPGESYADSRVAAQVGRWATSVAEWQTNYVVPQENGCRRSVRWATIGQVGAAGDTQLRIESRSPMDLAIRPWSNLQLDRAKHTAELQEDGLLRIFLDAGENGLGSATCGPGVDLAHQYRPGRTQLSCVLSVS